MIRSAETPALGGGETARLRTPATLSPEDALATARQIAPQSLFDFSHLYGPSSVRSTFARSMTRMPAAGGCVRETAIGLIDSRVSDHPSLDRADIENRRFSARGSSGIHGTAVASILVGDHPDGPSLADGVRVLAADVFNSESGTLVADAIDMIAALDWMAANGVKVVNMSLSGPPNELIADAVRAAAAEGMIIVAAAGNGGRRGGPRYPAALDEVIATAAIDDRRRPYRQNSSGDHIDIIAPGVDVWGADIRTNEGALWSGTSFAAPYVTAEIAAAVDRGLVSTVEEALAHLAANAVDLGPRGPDDIFGAGLLQATACR
ncbi:MAG: S8 family serine peptidase [Pseudomonadota bacterium]